METFIIKLAVAVIPLIALIASIIIVSSISHARTHHQLSWHRRRRHLLRACANGILVR